MLAAAVNLLASGTAFLISKRSFVVLTDEGDGAEQGPHNRTGFATSKVWAAIGCFAASGFVSMAYEIVWLRYLLFYFRDTAYLYAGILSIFIIGIAMGSFLCRRHISQIRRPFLLFGLLQLGIGIFTALAVYLPIPWQEAFFEAGKRSSLLLLGLLFLLLVLPAILMGAIFPTITMIITKDVHGVGREIGKAYALNTAGSISAPFRRDSSFCPSSDFRRRSTYSSGRTCSSQPSS